jgi:outer membrane protein
MKYALILLVIFLAPGISLSQEKLSLNDAIDAALEFNYAIKISQMEAEKSQNKVNRGYAGQLPQLSVNSGFTWSYTDQDLTPGSFFRNLSGPPAGAESPSLPAIQFNDVTTTQIQTAVVSRVTIYDGMRGRMRYKLLEVGSNLMDIHQQAEAERTILMVTQSYAKVALLQRSLALMEGVLAQSFDRFKTVEVRREYNLVNEQQRLQALVDLQNDSTSYKALQLEYDAAFRELHHLIGWKTNIIYVVDENPDIVSMPEYTELMSVFLRNNAELRMKLKQIEMSKLENRLSTAAFYPTLSASAQYGYQYMTASDGQFESNEQRGFTGGLTLSIPIFSGGRTKIDAQNSRLSHRQAQIQYEATEMQLRKNIDDLWHKMKHLEDQLQTDQSNLNTFIRNYERSREFFNQGAISGIDLRNAQLSLQQAKFRIAETEMNLMISQTQMLYLSGMLITLR